MSSAARRIASGSGSIGGQYPGRSTPPAGSHSIRMLATSFGKSISTGPGRPVVAMWNASATILDISEASFTR